MEPRNPRWVLAAFAVLFLCGSAYYFTVTVEKYGHTTVRVSNDGRYQYALALSLYQDGDLDLTNQYDARQLGNPHKYGPTATGRPANPLSIGPALLWAPTYFLARLMAPRGPLSDAHQMVTFYASFLCAFGAMLAAYAVARRRFDAGPAFAGAVVALAGGPVIQYTLHQPSYSHAPSALLVALLLWAWDRDRDVRSLRGWVVLGALIGGAMLMRAQNLVFALPVVGEGIWRIWRGREGGVKGVLRAAAGPIAGAVVAAAIFSIQLVVWDRIYGFGFGVPQGGGFVRWGSSMMLDTLFSANNGLFIYAPAWMVAIFGLAALRGRDPALGWWLAATFLVVAYVNGAVNDWWGLGGMTNRRFDGCLVHVAVGFSAVVAALAARPRLTLGLVTGGVALAGILVNFGLWDLYTRFYRDRPLDQTRSLAVYRKIFEHLDDQYLKDYGNPLTWPAAIPFAIDTATKLGKYEKVVGQDVIKGGVEEGDFKLRERIEQGVIRFAYPDDQKYLVRGFGGADANQRRLVGRRARFLVPINSNHPVRCRLVGEAVADVDLEVLWNGQRVGGGHYGAGMAIDVTFTLSPARVRRGVNEVVLAHPNIDAGAPAAAYARFELISGPARDLAAHPSQL